MPEDSITGEFQTPLPTPMAADESSYKALIIYLRQDLVSLRNELQGTSAAIATLRTDVNIVLETRKEVRELSSRVSGLSLTVKELEVALQNHQIETDKKEKREEASSSRWWTFWLNLLAFIVTGVLAALASAHFIKK